MYFKALDTFCRNAGGLAFPAVGFCRAGKEAEVFTPRSRLVCKVPDGGFGTVLFEFERSLQDSKAGRTNLKFPALIILGV